MFVVPKCAVKPSAADGDAAVAEVAGAVDVQLFGGGGVARPGCRFRAVRFDNALPGSEVTAVECAGGAGLPVVRGLGAPGPAPARRAAELEIPAVALLDRDGVLGALHATPVNGRPLRKYH